MRFVAVPPDAADAAADNLDKIDNIIIPMMENRSFDHMLGYLKLAENRFAAAATKSLRRVFPGDLLVFTAEFGPCCAGPARSPGCEVSSVRRLNQALRQPRKLSCLFAVGVMCSSAPL
jgi:hypothetical protein